MQRLEAAMQADDRRAFLEQLEAVDWSAHAPDDLVRTIQLALSMNLVWPARDLAEQGLRLFPDHEPLRRTMRVFEPPTVRMTRGTPLKGVKESHDWLRTHAHEYRGQWIAVNQGQLLGAARTLDDLRPMIEQAEQPRSTIVTKVLYMARFEPPSRSFADSVKAVRMLDRWKRRVRQLKQELYALYLAYRDPRVPWYARLFAACVVGYAFSPIDLIPDFIPVLGYLDDLVLIPVGIALALRMIPPNVMAESRTRAEELIRQGKPINKVAAALIIALWLLLAALSIVLILRFFGRNLY